MKNIIRHAFIKIIKKCSPIIEHDKKLLDDIIYKYTSLQSIKNRNLSDVYIVGFPKSGNTLMQNIMTGLVYEISLKNLSDAVIQELIPDIYLKLYYKRFSSTCFFKTHELPMPDYKNVIYIVRDGRDALVSYYHYNKALKKQYSIQEMIINGRGLYPSKWHIHVEKWIENPFKANILYIRYEDLLNNPLDQFQRICSFLSFERSIKFLEDLVEDCSFQNMKRKEIEQGWDDKNWNREHAFIRNGKIGSHLTEMNKFDIGKFNEESLASLKHFNYTTDF